MYHSISSFAHERFKRYTVSPAKFKEQMSYLHRHKYTPITVTQLAKAVTTGEFELPEQPVILTFDDAFADFYTDALPILKSYAFTATLYVPTAFVGGTSRWLQNEGESNRSLVSWAQLQEISYNQIECGAHSHNHLQLDRLPLPIAQADIFQSKQILEEKLNQSISSFAYPFGYYNAVVRQLVQEAGFSSACAVKYSMSATNDDLFALRRLIVTGTTEIDEFARLLASHNSPVKLLTREIRDTAANFLRRHIPPKSFIN